MNKLLVKILQSNQEQLLSIMSKYLSRKYDKVIATKDYIIAFGNIPIGLVAHLDTVFSVPPQNIYYDDKAKVMWSPDGLGTDDRAGIYGIIKIIEAGFLPHIILCTNEETGGKGALQLIEDIPDCPFQDLKCLIELDRAGKNDCVFYQCDNKDFTRFIESFGFQTKEGSFTDISILAPSWGVAAANLSIGYYNEHTYIEYFNVIHFNNTIAKVINILKNADNIEQYHYIPKIMINSQKHSSKCEICGKKISGIDNYLLYGATYWIECCPQCYTESFLSPF